MDNATQKYHVFLMTLKDKALKDIETAYKRMISAMKNINGDRRQYILTQIKLFTTFARGKIITLQNQAGILGSKVAVAQLENIMANDVQIVKATYLPPKQEDFFADVGPQAADKAMEALTKKPDNTSQVIADALIIALSMANREARTTLIDTYRESSIATYSANEVDGWLWVADGPKPCSFCQSMNWTIHDLSEKFESHDNCYCTTEPYIS